MSKANFHIEELAVQTSLFLRDYGETFSACMLAAMRGCIEGILSKQGRDLGSIAAPGEVFGMCVVLMHVAKRMLAEGFAEKDVEPLMRAAAMSASAPAMVGFLHQEEGSNEQN